MTAVERVLALARAEIGYLEKASNAQLDDKTANAGNANYTKYARDLDRLGFFNTAKNGFAWCAVFFNWCLVQAFGMELTQRITNQPPKGCGASCTEGAAYYRAAGRFFRSDPRAGDQIFFTKDGGKTFYHTGIVEKVEGGRVYTVEGNTSAASGVVANGGAVAAKSYSLNSTSIGGYGRPNYEIVEEDEEMTAEQVKKIAVDAAQEIVQAYRKDLQDNDAGDYSAEAREWAIRTGLFQGGGTLPDGTVNYLWQDLLTREQAAALFYRFARMKAPA